MGRTVTRVGIQGRRFCRFRGSDLQGHVSVSHMLHVFSSVSPSLVIARPGFSWSNGHICLNVSKAFQSYHSHSWFIDEASQNGGGPCVFVFVHFNPKELLKDVARVILHDVVRVVCEDHARAPIGSKLWNASWSTTWSYPLRSKEYDNQIQMSTSGPGYRDDMREDGVTWRSMRVIRVMRVQSWNTTSKSLSNNAAVLKRHVH